MALNLRVSRPHHRLKPRPLPFRWDAHRQQALDLGVERMLRLYFLQQWFNLSDPAVEEALYDLVAMRGFVGIDLGREPVPDETTVCRFRHLLEAHVAAARSNRHRRHTARQRPAGSFLEGFRTPAPSPADRSRRAGIRNPSRQPPLRSICGLA